MIKNCGGCKPNEYQDSTYGKNQRVMNQTADKNPTKYRCTVCEKEHASS